ncbi:MAG: hypothetical protein DRP09_16510 [Candidatus Thorarchaeota archaeon]|nr:MAG: hypothetical protein DRP09_16510 [Candidatus Thorarchaeota archaeon]
MLDEFTRRLIESARIPSQLSGQEARDFVSKAYMSYLAKVVFDSQDDDKSSYVLSLNRLSLATSLLWSSDEDNSTAFLVAEAADIARMIVQESESDLPVSARFKKGIHYLDLASFFHLVDYDANARVVTKEAARFLQSVDFVKLGTITASHVSYYKCLSYFLRGWFGHCRKEASQSIEANSAEERAFLFLRAYLANLTNKYKSQDFANAEQEKQMVNLVNALEKNDHSYFSLASESTRLVAFDAAINRKSAYRLLLPVLGQEYLTARISSDDNQGYPFAWPPVRNFCQKYFSEDAQHAVITVPTGGGKSFLAELATARALQDGWVLYLAPTNALCSQIREDLKQNLQSLTSIDVEAFLGKSEYMAELPRFQVPKQVLVVTPEKALLLLKREPDRFSECSLAVLDECHMLGDNNRGDIAETVLAFTMAKNPDVHIILMSAMVKQEDSAKLVQWLEENTGKLAVSISLPWRPTRTARLTVFPDWSTLDICPMENEKAIATIQVKAFADTVTPWDKDTPLESWKTPIRLEKVDDLDTFRTKGPKFAWRNDVSRELAELFTAQGIPTIIFMLHSRHQAFSVADRFDIDLPERPEVTQHEQDLYILAEYELGANSLLEKLVDEKGVAVHTAVMLDCERKVSELAFKSGRAFLLVATGTLSQGLNLPAKAVIICGTELSPYGDWGDMTHEERKRVSLNQVLNAAGRAARANISCRGVSIIVPDELPRVHLDESSLKELILSKMAVLAMKDASLEVSSPIRDRLERIGQRSDQDIASVDEHVLLSRLPIDSENRGLTIRNMLGAYELPERDYVQKITERFEAIETQAIDSGCDKWLLEAASLAGIEYTLASNLKSFIEFIAHMPDFSPPEDTYIGWAGFLLKWLKALPASATWNLLRAHIKARRYSWGKQKDPDLLKLLKTDRGEYPEYVTEKLLLLLVPVWENLGDTIHAWLNDNSLLEIGEVLTRRKCDADKRRNRSAAGNYLPRAILWSRRVINHLSQFAGLLLAVQNQWAENDLDSMPRWFANTITLHTFPLGLRHGVRDPAALAWHRYAIQERRAANLLQALMPLEVENITDLQEAWQYVFRASKGFVEGSVKTPDSQIVLALQRIIQVK